MAVSRRIGRRRILAAAVVALLALAAMGAAPGETSRSARSCLPERPEYIEFRDHIDSLYGGAGLEGSLDYAVFELALIGYYNMLADSLIERESIITIIDYTVPSTEERLFVVDLVAGELLYASLVSHGLNTGENYAEDFSNTPGSLQTSLGFYITGIDYYGEHGGALKLSGVDTLYNDNAMKRCIVMHGAWYCSEEFIEEHGRLGRSWGCPVLPLEVSAEIIDAVKDGTCMFVYSDDDEYLENSIYLEIDGAVQEFGERNARR